MTKRKPKMEYFFYAPKDDEAGTKIADELNELIKPAKEAYGIYSCWQELHPHLMAAKREYPLSAARVDIGSRPANTKPPKPPKPKIMPKYYATCPKLLDDKENIKGHELVSKINNTIELFDAVFDKKECLRIMKLVSIENLKEYEISLSVRS